MYTELHIVRRTGEMLPKFLRTGTTWGVTIYLVSERISDTCFSCSGVYELIWIFSDCTDFRRFYRFGIPRYFDEILLVLFGAKQ